jgi:hypothetical protein
VRRRNRPRPPGVKRRILADKAHRSAVKSRRQKPVGSDPN